MARVHDLVPFCLKHGLKMITVADLAHHRWESDPPEWSTCLEQ
jgi:3,4-dihydroxy-2-butanone 4-phosphate synthase